ncbi:hypothetical protein F5144DRAFT_599313 [Chaetomium tenue]|uniref:Uncharacterized protein n=1 Tax=Chaetomium tenue TaxID=1854479 RepID=A0ACB7PHV4_9PEZI|nr:hypothetical protein F5144DRAFT_599313 [Chaetomium globosum]
MSPSFPPRTWTREVSGTSYTISTDPSLIQLDAVNAAFASDMVYWAKPLTPDALKICVEQSLCFGLYAAPAEDGNHQGQKATPPPMTGFARLVTDYTTFAYLTDVYILPAHQGRGLGKWLVQCVDEVLAGWPELRRCLLLTRDETAVRMYEAMMGARVITSEGGGGLFIMERKGGGNVYGDGNAGVGRE